ncbi:hypothetical protein F0L74_26820 [Chitinophaga agrisoli]|uniref:Uncharacterized protein n=1 Tax=Chitinophaga agrisoli TaxID=2607653 RepID=A0A5B2VN13_9BACT|nr:hypothetical protein [Chitinophaga agrisoli]KAA2239806.1 hypothetical protein F0L74_26820 [Chitinophaga agrisoli]
MKRYFLYGASLLLIIMTGCKKYEEAPPISNAAYMRVFNDLAFTVDVWQSGQSAPFLTFIMDPHMDGAGIPDTGAVVGDFLGTRQLYSLSYPINEANSSIGTSPDQQIINTVNYEYPGNAHVLTAPAINGFDLSAWAQVPEGSHRILFVTRPQDNVPFKQLSAANRSSILLDTVVNFEKGEVYTLEVVSRDLDNKKYGLYVRKEAFIHQSFETNKLYVGFVNLSGKRPLSSQYDFVHFYPDNTGIYYTYNIPDDQATIGFENDPKFNPLPGYDNAYYTTLRTTMDTVIPYMALPLLPQSAFFRQDTLRTYADKSAFLAGLPSSKFGTLPYVKFTLADPTKVSIPFTLSCIGDPNTFNTYDPANSSALFYTPNLNLIVNTGNAYHVYSTLNIMEMIYDRVYMMQIQRGFNEVPEN